MKAEGLDRLTEKQRECLRLVYAHKETKEIARLLGLSPDGVNQRIKTAMNTLGVARRRDAAQLVAEAEGLGTYPPLVHGPRDIAAPHQSATIAASTEDERQAGHSGGSMREGQAAFVAPALQRPSLPLPILGGRPNDLGALQRLGWIFAVMLLIAFTFGVFLAGVDALSRLGRLIAS
jgi:DNA-binding CsgD family transcriptional regulator